MAMAQTGRLEGGQEDDFLSQDPTEYRPHRPHHWYCGRLQDFHAVGTKHCLPTARDHCRPLSKVSPAYRPPENIAFCRSFTQCLTLAVGAVGILSSITDGL